MAENHETENVPRNDKETAAPVGSWRLLKIVLLLTGLVWLFFGTWAFYPREWLAWVFNIWGNVIGEDVSFTCAPVEVYAFRMAYFSFLVMGVFIIIAATDPVRYRPIVLLTIALAGGYALYAPIAGKMSGVGVYWYALDAAPALALFLLLMILRPAPPEQ